MKAPSKHVCGQNTHTCSPTRDTRYYLWLIKPKTKGDKRPGLTMKQHVDSHAAGGL